jgi:hypothetical protein
MPDGSSNNGEAPADSGAAAVARTAAAADFPLRTRLAMVAMGFIPAVHVVLVVASAVLPLIGALPTRWLWATPAVLYIVPPIVVRVVTRLWPLPRGKVPVASPGFLAWWFTAQWQVLFTRLTFFEETLRLFPGLYSTWLRLWGARVGGLVYWSPGLVILDRPLVEVGSRVVFGAGVRLNPHVLMPGDDGRPTLAIAPIRIGSDVMVGGYGLLLAGVTVEDGASTPPLRAVAPFTHVSGGVRSRQRGPSSTAAMPAGGESLSASEEP